jgi:hypothetical protein
MFQMNPLKRSGPMKTPPYFVIFSLLLALGCENDPGREMLTPQLDVLSSRASASGHGNWFNAAGEYVSRSFHGVTKKDGTVEGQFVQHITALNGDKRVNKGDINCLRLIGLNDDDAVLSGPIHENANLALIGQTQIFRIQDNGEGSSDLPDEPDQRDQMSPLFFRTAESGIDCSNFTPLVVTPIEGGNLQVKP